MNPIRQLCLQSVAAGFVLLGAAAALAQPLPVANPESVGMSSARLGKITAVFKQEVADKKLPGAVVIDRKSVV